MNPNPKTWNKGKSVGRMKPLTDEQVELIRKELDKNGELRDQVLFSVSIDTMLRSVDLLNLCVSNVVNSDGEINDTFIIRQKKTNKSVVVVLTDTSKELLSMWIEVSGKQHNDFLFTGLRRWKDRQITHEAYRQLVKKWVKMAHLDPAVYSTHSMRRSKASYIYKKTHNVEAIRILLGHSSLSATSHYLGLEQEDALNIARQIQM